MRDVLREEGGLLNKPLTALGGVLAITMALAVAYNALWVQSSQSHNTQVTYVQGGGASSRIDVVATPTKQNTIILRYDAQIEELQRSLLTTGDYRGLVDGVSGKQTKLAIENYQRKAGLPVNGTVSPELMEHVRFTVQVSQAAEFTASVEKTIQKDNTSEIRQLQSALADLGYEPGEITGKMTTQTQAAIAKFSKDHSLRENNKPTPELMAEIARLTGDPIIALAD